MEMIRRQFTQCQFYPKSSQQDNTHSQLSWRKRGGERRVRYLICPLFGHPSPLLINCKCSNWQQLLGPQIKQMNENYTSFRSASLLHNHTVPAALERENRNLAFVTNSQVEIVNSFRCHLVRSKYPMNCIMGNGKLMIKWQGTIIWCRTQQFPSTAMAFFMQNCTADHFVTSTSSFKCTRWVDSTPWHSG